jgi:probable selenium-dependent hydroxylase accessory protein YqeC
VVVCAHLDILGQPVSDNTVHRLAQAEALGLRVGQRIEPADIARVLANPRAGLKGAPSDAKVVALLTQRDLRVLHPQAIGLCEQLTATRRFDRVVAAALRAEQPVLAAYP